jgi:hypothetical protein
MADPAQKLSGGPSEWGPSFEADWGPTSQILAYIVQKWKNWVGAYPPSQLNMGPPLHPINVY